MLFSDKFSTTARACWDFLSFAITWSGHVAAVIYDSAVRAMPYCAMRAWYAVGFSAFYSRRVRSERYWCG